MKEGFSTGNAQGTSEIPLHLGSMRAYTGYIHRLVAGSYIPDPMESIDFSVERLLALHIRRPLSRLRRWQKGGQAPPEHFQQDQHTIRGEMEACRARKPRRRQDEGHQCYPRPELGLGLKVKQTRHAYGQGKAESPSQLFYKCKQTSPGAYPAIA
jgi:hypothetical protein